MTRSRWRTNVPSWIAAACAAAGALTIAPTDRAALPRVLHELSAPLVLPQLWTAFGESELHGSLGEQLERARVLVRFLPTWTDGRVHFAALLAFSASRTETDPERALDRLHAALTWLDESAEECPDQAGDLLAAKAHFLEIRVGQDPALGAAFERRFGTSPLAAADAWLQRSEASAPLASTAQRRAWLALRQIASALRMGDDTRAAELADVALARLAPTDARLTVPEYRRALALAASAARGATGPDALASEPLLSEIEAALRARERAK